MDACSAGKVTIAFPPRLEIVEKRFASAVSDFFFRLKSDDGLKVVAKMKEMPTDDPLFGKGTIRADGRKIHPAYLMEVKKPAESKGPWDYYKVRATIPADQAFRPLKDGDCPLVK